MALVADTRKLAGESLKSIATPNAELEKEQNEVGEHQPQQKDSLSRQEEITHLEEQIIGYGLDLRARGLEITYITLQVCACQIDEDFRKKNKFEQYRKENA